MLRAVASRADGTKRPGAFPRAEDRDTGGSMPVPEAAVEKVVKSVSKKMRDPSWAQVAVGEFVEAQPDLARFVALHDAPCSVLVARERPSGLERPGSIVVGLDGSPESAVAAGVATALAERLGVGAELYAIRDGKDFDQSAVDLIAENVRFEDGKPVDMLVGATTSDDLLVVGSRGLHGIRALGSVSERVAHQAPCSVLVVRASAAAAG